MTAGLRPLHNARYRGIGTVALKYVDRPARCVTHREKTGSGRNFLRSEKSSLEMLRRQDTIQPSGREGGSMVRELHLLAVGIVFAFLGAIVVGIF
jgi:hypothetical protein